MLSEHQPARYNTKGLPKSLVLFLTDLEDEISEGGSWGSEEQEIAWLVVRRLFNIPVEKRMENMGMEEATPQKVGCVLPASRTLWMESRGR